MTRFLLFLIIGLIAFACGEDRPKDNEIPVEKVLEFKNFEEKISYAIGLDNGFTLQQVYNGEQTAGKFDMLNVEAGILDYLGDGKLKIELSEVDSILDLYLVENGGVSEEFVSKSDASYAIGLIEGQTLVASLVGRGIDQKMEIDLLLKGIQDGMHNRQNSLSLVEARKEVSAYYIEMNQLMGKSFLDNNKQNPGIIETASGLQYEVIKEGNGIKPNLTDSVVVHYTGRFIDGRTFESTIPSGIPAKMTLMGVIQGWQEGLMLMKEGGSSRFFVPFELGYGDKGSGPIEPFSTLVFDIELIQVKRFKPN
jgi:FKBP-type peptidyl-prolyl cis-trans isomerase